MGLRLMLLISALSSVIACAPVGHGSTSDTLQASAEVDPDAPVTPTPLPADDSVYYKMFASAGMINRSSELKLENGNCFLSNLYDFPDWIFGDDSLDNLTTQPMPMTACRRLAIAKELVASGGACTPMETALTSAELSQMSLSLASSQMSALFGTSSLTLSDLSNGVSTLRQREDCTCALNFELGLNGTTAVAMDLPPPLDLCRSKFSRYDTAPLSAALLRMKVHYGID